MFQKSSKIFSIVKILMINFSFNIEETINVFQNNNYQSEKEKTTKINENKSIQTCRICFNGKSNESDPLISPCKCSGSMSYIHFYCLKQCLNVKVIKTSTDHCVYYNLKNYECEICLAEYPKYLRIKNRMYNLIDIKSPFDDYAVLDYILYHEEKHIFKRKGFIVLKLAENEEMTIVRILNKDYCREEPIQII